MLAGLMSSLVFGVGLFAFEAARIGSAQRSLQAAANAAAVAAAKELPVLGGSEPAMTAVARGVAEANIGIEPAEDSDDEALKVAAALEQEGTAVSILLRYRAPVFFGKLVNIGDPWITASATAEIYGESRICVIALSPDGHHSLDLHDTAKLTGAGCGVFVNSSDTEAIHTQGDVEILAPVICMGGGYRGEARHFGSVPITDCPAQPDPLSSRVVTADTTCTFAETVTLKGLTDPAKYGL